MQFVDPAEGDEDDDADPDRTRPAIAAPKLDLSQAQTQRAMPAVKPEDGLGPGLDEATFDDATVPSGGYPPTRGEE